ncbi:unnamed protein product [Ascophyllum nodosum]
MHQVFLTRRALYLLVWDVTLFRNLDSKKKMAEITGRPREHNEMAVHHPPSSTRGHSDTGSQQV